MLETWNVAPRLEASGLHTVLAHGRDGGVWTDWTYRIDRRDTADGSPAGSWAVQAPFAWDMELAPGGDRLLLVHVVSHDAETFWDEPYVSVWGPEGRLASYSLRELVGVDPEWCRSASFPDGYCELPFRGEATYDSERGFVLPLTFGDVVFDPTTGALPGLPAAPVSLAEHVIDTDADAVSGVALSWVAGALLLGWAGGLLTARWRAAR